MQLACKFRRVVKSEMAVQVWPSNSQILTHYRAYRIIDLFQLFLYFYLVLLINTKNQ